MDTFDTLIETEKANKMNDPSSSSSVAAISEILGSNVKLTKSKMIRLALTQAKDECLLAAAVNNYAICALYLKRSNAAIATIEKLICEDPVQHMTDPMIFNLCTMYDLSFAPDVSSMKKKILQKIANRYGLVDPVLHWRSFRTSY